MLVATFGPLDLEVPRVVIERQVEMARRSRFELADANPQDVARPVRHFHPLAFFALENKHIQILLIIVRFSWSMSICGSSHLESAQVESRGSVSWFGDQPKVFVFGLASCNARFVSFLPQVDRFLAGPGV